MLSVNESRHISHESENVYFNFRTCGIALHDGRVLMVKIEPYDFWLIPGGRVEYMESSKDALKREVKEELGVSCTILKLLWHVEDFYFFEGKDTHEICYYYQIDFTDHPEIYEKDSWTVNEEAKEHENAKKLTFQWFPLKALKTINLIPKYISVELCSLPTDTKFLIINHLKKDISN